MGAALAAGLAAALCGCTTTQTTAARLQLNDSRLRAEADAVRVGPGQTSTAVTATSATFLAQGATVDVAVVLEDRGDLAVSDLPISVGYQRGSRTVYLNGAEGLVYFDNHLPSIRPHGTLTWVYTGAGKLPRGAQTFVRVGARPSIAVGRVTPEAITVVSRTVTGRASGAGSNRRPSFEISVTNRSSVTQYQLPVYAVATRGGRIVAAIDRSVADLGSGATTVLRLFLPPNAVASSVRVEAPATIFK